MEFTRTESTIPKWKYRLIILRRRIYRWMSDSPFPFVTPELPLKLIHSEEVKPGVMQRKILDEDLEEISTTYEELFPERTEVHREHH